VSLCRCVVVSLCRCVGLFRASVFEICYTMTLGFGAMLTSSKSARMQGSLDAAPANRCDCALQLKQETVFSRFSKFQQLVIFSRQLVLAWKGYALMTWK